MVQPDWNQIGGTSPDGGVLFINVPPGRYTLTAKKEGSNFEENVMNCRPGIFVNGAPPNGLLRY